MSDSTKLISLWIITGAVIFLAARYFLPLMGPFLAAALLACIIDPAVTFLARKARLSRGVAALVVLTGVIVLVSAGIVIGAAQIYAEIEQLWRLLPAYDATLTQIVNKVIEEVSRFYKELPPPVLEAIRRNQNRLYLAAESVLSAFMSALAGLPALGVFIVVSVIAAYFMSRDKDAILDFLLRLVPGRLKERARSARLEVFQATVGFVRAQVILIAITTVISIIGLAIIRVRYAWLLGILAGIFDFIPVVGPGTIFVPMMVYYFFIDRIWAAIVLAGIMVVTFIARRIAEPKVLAAGIGLHPLAVLISIYIGARLFGALGFIIGPLVAVIIKAVVNAGILPLLPKE
ncbi:MAG TPA: sporulation integral membrane protein YtvI [Firmicutes bacterium]|nr:sporulation integral membrane protein YtvI [Bacillota bacterium]